MLAESALQPWRPACTRRPALSMLPRNFYDGAQTQ